MTEEMIQDAEIVNESTGEVVATQADALATFGDATLGIERARGVANMLAAIIEEKGLSTRIGRNDHIHVEAWCAAASMCGMSPLTEWSREVRNPETGALEGYEARVIVKRIATGEVVGAAEAGCYYDEDQWRNRDRHALKSMAQTRATSKSIGQVLRWIAVLAGFSGTPYEEMPRDGGGNGNQAPPRRQADQPAFGQRQERTYQSDALISDKQRGLLWARASDRAENLGSPGKDHATYLLRDVCAPLGYESSNDIKRSDMDKILAAIDTFHFPDEEGQ